MKLWGRSTLALAAMLVAIFCGPPAQAYEAQIEGGNGGGPFRVQCNGFVTGFEGRTGAYIDNFRLDCGVLDPGSRQLRNVGAVPVQVGDSGGGGPSAASCPDGWGISRIEFSSTYGDRGQPAFVHHLNFVCVSIGGNETIARTYGPTTPVATSDSLIGGHYLPYYFYQACPAGEYMIGFQGRSGLYVDALGLICGPVPAAPAPKIAANLPVTLQSGDASIDTANRIIQATPHLGGILPASPPPPVAPGGKSDETPTGAQLAAKQSSGFTGTWNTRTDKNWTYEITFIQDGANVQGTYVAQNGDKGRIKGTVKDQVLQFNWEQDGGFTGTGQFALAADGNSFTGIYQGNPHAGLDPAYRQGSWNGTRR